MEDKAVGILAHVLPKILIVLFFFVQMQSRNGNPSREFMPSQTFLDTLNFVHSRRPGSVDRDMFKQGDSRHDRTVCWEKVPRVSSRKASITLTIRILTKVKP